MAPALTDSYLVLLPSIYPPWTDTCLASCQIDRNNFVVIDNTQENRGVAASWNVGASLVLEDGLDWLIVLSAAMRFGPAGGLDFLERLAENPDAYAVEAHPHYGWHCIGFHRRIFEAVGLFDENFWPGYWEDIDFSYRFALHRNLPTSGIVEPYWRKVPLDAELAGYAHGIDLAGIRPDHDRLEAYYIRKWGGSKGAEAYTHPFDDPEMTLAWWPRPPDPRAETHAGWPDHLLYSPPPAETPAAQQTPPEAPNDATGPV